MSTCLTSNVIQQHGVVKTTRSCVRDKIRRHPNSQYRANPYAFSFLSFDNSRLTIEDLLIRATIVLNRSKSFKAARLFLTINFRPQALLSHFFATSSASRAAFNSFFLGLRGMVTVMSVRDNLLKFI
eukprot:TRINITY_DN1213_c0_g1_i2.p1 TRINITY_DN1213_c0_g1~~TRINITY_DN1213_c0_g1_i2.p1  ORF type:complete len:127 (-),score=4.51 TRINITY_DN1213_c0_g1_i2:270-650(-)